MTRISQVQVYGPADHERQFYALGNGGNVYEAQANATNIWDMQLTSEEVGADGIAQLFGGEYWTDGNTEEGDYVEFCVVDKDDVLGYFAGLGLTPGVDVLELAKYVRKRPVVNNERGIVSPNKASNLVQGLYLRTIYVAANAGVPRKLRVAFWLAK